MFNNGRPCLHHRRTVRLEQSALCDPAQLIAGHLQTLSEKKSGASLVLHDPCRSASSVSQLLQQSEQTFRIKFVLFSWGGTKPLHRPYPITLLQNLSSEQVAMQIKYSGYWAAIHCRYVVPWSFTLRHVHHSSQYSHFLLFPKTSPLCR